ncbi:MAG: 3-phosphoshikimate 1-carboxyvinyltransferase, partial [Nitrospinae bacterium]|nr:3-phosphoshikimate 1-carboxyvinyltransferase [Nitrospinota bacterium]
VIDPCCGTGTIARAAYELKTSRGGMNKAQAISTVWASDKFQFPLQLGAIALADPEALGEIIRIFKQDVFAIHPGQQISFTDPNTGKKIATQLPRMGSIVSNLPFVRFEDVKTVNKNVAAKLKTVTDGESISGKSDLFAYIVLYLKTLLKDQGRIGIIVSNAWLGTDWGAGLRKAMEKHFHIRIVVSSGASRWFDQTKVVTNIVVLEKKGGPEQSGDVKFVTTLKPIAEWDPPKINEMTATIISAPSAKTTDTIQVNVYSSNERALIEKICVGWSCFFTDVHWVKQFQSKLIKVSSLFDIGRGERRGWDDMFYPDKGHGIERDYIRPVLKNTRNVQGYIAEPDVKAFCCSEDIKALKTKGHKGAIAWIKRFESLLNEKGKPLPDALARANHQWYEMKPDALADFVMGMNPEDRLFVAKMKNRGFVNQRLIRFTKKGSQLDMPLVHALLNSTFGLFMIEAAGFGRGLGALDIQPSKLKEGFYMLDPSQLNGKSRDQIVATFEAVKKRNVWPLAQELEQSDRLKLDTEILTAYGMEKHVASIRESLSALYRIRKSVKSNIRPCIEIQPATRIRATAEAPPSKSYTNRALIIAGLADGESRLDHPLFSDDTRYMQEAIVRYGVPVKREADALIVSGKGGVLQAPREEIYVGNAGTAMRFLATFAALAPGTSRLTGDERMRERPIEDLLAGLRAIGVPAESVLNNQCPPLVVHGGNVPGGEIRLAADKSSQYLTSLLLSAPYFQKDTVIRIAGELTSKSYVDITLDIMKTFGVHVENEGYAVFRAPAGQKYAARDYAIEGDASSASYFFASAAVSGGEVAVTRLNPDSVQGDLRFLDALEQMGCRVEKSSGKITVAGNPLRGISINMNTMPDVVQTLAVVALFADGPTAVAGIGNLRIKETDRIAALERELTRLGARVESGSDYLTVHPAARYSPAEIETYNDHRMAMSFAVAGLKVPGVKIKNPECVSKSFPDFFERFKKLHG